MLNSLLKLISRLPPEGFAVLTALIRALSSARDPLEATKRAAQAVASAKASREYVQRKLKKGAKR